jgi:ketosteroid isomerase-like protein
VSRNVETVQRALDAMNHRNVDQYLTCCTDDVELRPPTSAIEGAYEGRAGVRRFFAEIEDTGPDFRLDADSIDAVGANRVIAFLHATLTGRASGAATSLPVTTVYDLADGRIRRIRVFQDRAAAIEAAELAE